MKYLNQKGETIVEVLIAISILGFALGLGYATASRSSKNIQANKERYQATLYANQQANKIRAFVIGNSTARTSLNNSPEKCFGIDNNIYESTNANCTLDSIYNIKITKVSDGTDFRTYNVYKIRVEWDSIIKNASGNKDNVEIYYGT